jgi:hypothetical protein
MQVVRYFYLTRRAKRGKTASYTHMEVVQRWIDDKGNHAVKARLRPMGFHCGGWHTGSALELRPYKVLYDIIPDTVYPRIKVLDKIKRHGFNGCFNDIAPAALFYLLLSDNRIETLMKAKQYALTRYFVYKGIKYIDRYWPSIKICLRNGYTADDVSLWCDYVNMLAALGKDTLNAVYVCPADLRKEHDRYMILQQKHDDRIRHEKAIAKAEQYRERFIAEKSRFFGITISDGALSVSVIDSMEGIIEEGETMHHCVFRSDYHLKTDSLILSATIDGVRIETVELSLSTFKVLQSRGVCNSHTEHHDSIIALVESNRHRFIERMAG